MLSELAVRQATPKDRDYKLSDAEGLHLFVAKSGHRSWRLKYRFAGKERRLILGSYPAVSLKEARERKCEARRLLDAGRDPGIDKFLDQLTEGLGETSDGTASHGHQAALYFRQAEQRIVRCDDHVAR